MTTKKILSLSAIALTLWSCSPQSDEKQVAHEMGGTWPKAVTYEIFVQSFNDSDGDGIGDIKGMTQKLDYLQDLGVEAVWLMPIGPSPSYHKYDVTDYKNIHPDYGTLEDYKTFIKEAHKRDIRVVMDLVINHTAYDHPWFQSAMKDKNSPYRDYYVWANEDSIRNQIEKSETHADSGNLKQWHEVEGSKERYYGYFWGGMPDLNFDNPKVKQEIFDIGRFWLSEVGVDGFRLDAAKHIFPDDRAEDNHKWWVEFRTEMEKVKPEVYLVGEVWDEAEVVAPYMKGLHALFNFDLGYAITDAVKNEQAGDLIKKHKEIRDFYKSVNPEFVDATFITNHDQNRIMSVLDGDMNKARMAASLLFTLPGSPYMYYGEEIGMKGMKPDEHIREPFLWSVADDAQPQWMEAKYSTEETVDALEEQKAEASSIYNHYKALIKLRKEVPALTHGALELADIEGDGIAAFYRVHGDEKVLVLHNLTASNQKVAVSNGEVIFGQENAKLTKESTELSPYSTIVLKM